MSEFSLPAYTVSAPVAVQVALKALTEVAPSLLDNSVPLPRRVALARAWVSFLCLAGAEWCPRTAGGQSGAGIPDDPRDWDAATLERVARLVVDFAYHILKPFIKGHL